MERHPLVSILIPVYNVEKYLPHCLDSVINQTYSHLQIVLIDDGSKDTSFFICKEYANKDKRFEIYHQDNQGVAATRNHLLEKAKGDYVLFVDSDDWIEVDMVDHLLSLGVQKDADIVMCDRVINDNKPSLTKPIVVELSQEKAIKDYLYHNYFIGSLCDKLIKANLLQNLTFNSSISYGEDALFCWQVLQWVKKVIVTNKQLYHYRMNEVSLSHSYNGHQFSAYYVWQTIVNDVVKYYPQFLPIAQGHFCVSMTMVLYNAARHGYHSDENTKRLCSVVKKYKFEMLRHIPHSFKKYFLASLFSWNYNLARILLKN
ncbi:MAG: glycosyltransferase [Prevotella sp.]|nr:glycosyltransferase [Prevotella sp.]